MMSSAYSDDDMNQQVVANNMRLVVNIAKRYSDHGMTFPELVREGSKGLIYASEHFARDGGFCFVIYAVQCVRQNIERAILNQEPSVHAHF